MKKFLTSALLILFAVVLASGCFVAVAEPTETPSVYASFVEDYCTVYTNYLRDPKNNVSPIAYLKASFDNVFDGRTNVTFTEKDFVFNNGESSVSGANLIYSLNYGATQTVILGAHYDATDGACATDNATGVATLYFTAKRIASEASSLPFNVKFVLFDQEENRLRGSYDYVNSMSKAERDSTLCMINFDSVGGGDNLYVMCENKPTSLAKFVLQCASDQNLTVLEKPYAKGVTAVEMYYAPNGTRTVFQSLFLNGYGYYERVQNSDHTPFRLAGIPTLFFFSGNFSTLFGYEQSADSENCVMNTPSDTYVHAVNHTCFDEQIGTAVDTVTSALLSNEFAEKATATRSELVNLFACYGRLWPKLVAVVLAGTVVALFFSTYNKLKKQAILGDSGAKEQKTVFTAPNSDDIFTFDDGKNSADDVFKF